MRPEGGKAVEGAGSPCGAGAGAAGPVISAESAPCEVLDVGGECGATLVAAVGASAEPVPPPEGTVKTEEKAVSAAGKLCSRRGWQSSVVTAAVTRATNLPEGAERSSILICGPCVLKSRKSEDSALGVEYQSTQTNIENWRGTSAKPTGPDEEDNTIFRGMRLLDLVRSCSVAGSVKQDRKSAFPLVLPLRSSRA